MLYHLCVSLVGAWLCVYSASDMFLEKDVPICITLMMPAMLIVFFFVYLLVVYLMDRKNTMLHTFNEVVAYRKKQKVVTRDNDHEVIFFSRSEKGRQATSACNSMDRIPNGNYAISDFVILNKS